MMMLILCEVRDQGSDAGDETPVAYVDKAIKEVGMEIRMVDYFCDIEHEDIMIMVYVIYMNLIFRHN